MGFKESKNFSLNSIAKEIQDFWLKMMYLSNHPIEITVQILFL